MIKPGESPVSSWEEKYEKEHKLRQEAEGEINTLKNKIANFEETLKSRDYFKQHDYQFLIDENRKLEEERNELLMDNKRLSHQIDDQVNQLRKAGVL